MLGCSLLAVVALFFCFLYGSLGYLCMMGGILAKLFGFVVLVDSVSGVSSMFLYDGMSLFLSILSVWVSSLTVLAMSNTDSKNSPLFFFFSGMMLCMLLFSFMLFDLLGFYLFFEAVLIPMVMMIYLWGKQLERQTAGLYMLMYTLFGSLPLLVVLLGVSFKMEVSYMFLGYFVGLDIKNLFMFMLFFAFLVKMPMYSVHLWLPKAHVEAPVAGSMMLAGILLKLGAYGFYRVYFMICYWHLYFCDFLVMSVSLVGSVIVSFICLRQTDVKCLIAYSSVCHMGLVIGGCYSGTIYSSSGVLILMLGHGLCSSALFCLSSFMYERFFTRSLLLMSGMMGIFPILSLWWFIFCVINMGAPPFMNLCGEILLLATILMWDFYSIFLVCLISFFSAGYSLYLFSFLQHGSTWFVYGGLIVNMCEFVLLYGHLFPLFLYLMKMDIFINWV